MSAADTVPLPAGHPGPRSPLRLAWRRFRSDRLAIVALGVLGLLVLVAIFAPLLTGALGAPGPDVRDASALTPFGSPTGPSGQHLFGVDPLGRDVFARVIYGGRVSLLLAFAGAGTALLVGVVLGLAAGWLGGPVEIVIARGGELLRTFPAVLLAGALAAACTLGHGCLGGLVTPGVPTLLAAVTLAGIPPVARTVRGEVASLRARPFVRAARGTGASNRRLIIREILPNLRLPVLVAATSVLPESVLITAALSFLGVGARPPTPSWGEMLAGATPVFSSAWWYVIFPGAALTVTALALTLVADGARSALAHDG